MNCEEIDQIFRLVDREVWVVTAAAGDRRGGLLATWVLQASIDPQAPLVVAGIAPNHHTAELVEESRAFAVHLIGQEHLPLAWRFGMTSGRDCDKLAGLNVHIGETGSPILEDCLAWLDCRVIHRHDGGDRTFFWADVINAGQVSTGMPLTEKRMAELASLEQKLALRDQLAADINVQQTLRAQWRAGLVSLHDASD